MDKIFKFSVDIEKKVKTPVFDVNTNDLKSIKLLITITSGLVPIDLTGISPRLAIKKPDKEVVFQDCAIADALKGLAEVTLETQAYTIPGTHSAEIMLYKGQELVSVSGTFNYNSVLGIMNNAAVESKSEFIAISKQLFGVESAIKDLRDNGTGIDAQARQDIQTVNTQLAEDIYYDEITTSKYRDAASLSDYYITHIPHKDGEGNIIKLKHGYQNDAMNSGNGETARSFSARHGASFVSNASIWDMDTGLIKGVQIQDGVIKQGNGNGSSYTLGVTADNTLKMFSPTVPAADILAQGCIQAFTAFYPMIENSVAVDPAIYNVISNPSEPNPRQVIAQLPNKDILFMTVEGRLSTSNGMTYDDVIRVLLTRGVQTAYCLDGGGSAQSVLRGMLINTPVDENNKKERLVGDFIYFEKPANHKQNFNVISKDLGELSKKVIDIGVDLKGKADVVDVAPNTANINNITKTGLYWCGANATGSPGTYSWGIMHFQAGASSALQIAYPYHGTSGMIKLRRTVNDMTSWTAWRDM